MVKVMYNDQLVYKVVIWSFFGISLWKEKVVLRVKIVKATFYTLIGHCTSLSPWFIILDKNHFVKVSHHYLTSGGYQVCL